MPSTPTIRNRLEKQAAGENLNSWGAPKLNTVLDLVDVSLDGWTTKALTADHMLTSANYAADEARARVLKFTGVGGFTVTLPSFEKAYYVWNACTGALTITTGAGEAAFMAAGEIAPVICDASNVRKVKVIDYGADNVSSSAAPTDASHLANKAYVDGLAFAAADLPGQNAGTTNQFIQSNGATASWMTPSVAHISGAAPLESPSFTGGVVAAGDLTLAGAASVTGDASIAGAAEVGGMLTLGGGLDQAGGSKIGITAISADDIDFSDNDCQTKSINMDTTFTVSGLEAGKLQIVVLILTITSDATPSFPAGFGFEDGVNFLADLGDGTHWLTLVTSDGGATGVVGVLFRNAS